MTTATYLFEPTHRGPRGPGFYGELLELQALVAAGYAKSAIAGFYRRYLQQSVNRIASAAGPYTPELAVKLFRATASLFARTEIDLQGLRRNSSTRLPSASGSSGASAKAAAPATGAGAKGGGVGAAIKSAFAMVAKIMTMAAGPAGFSRRSDEDDDVENHFWARCSQIEPEKLKAQYTNG